MVGFYDLINLVVLINFKIIFLVFTLPLLARKASAFLDEMPASGFPEGLAISIRNHSLF